MTDDYEFLVRYCGEQLAQQHALWRSPHFAGDGTELVQSEYDNLAKTVLDAERRATRLLAASRIMYDASEEK